jgi:xylan 1,4-beta-xylosidase
MANYSARIHNYISGMRLLSLFLFLPGFMSAETFTVDLAASGHPFPHFWEQVFGSGRANLSLREAYRADLRAMRPNTDIRYVRFHAIFHDENGLYDEDSKGNPVYNFSYVDQIYDGLLSSGVRPFVELSFMPAKLAASPAPHAFWYRPLPSPPKDYAKWGALIEAFARHLVSRYGIDEVAQWYFEVWNEPNIDFWTGEPKQETYMRLYAESARSLKRVSPGLRVGGPATAQAAWIPQFIELCMKRDLPIDFVSTHVYGNDKAEDVFGTHEAIPRRDMVARAVRKVYEEVKHSSRPDLPIHWTEYNASYFNEVNVTDSPFMGPWLANTIRLCDGLVSTMSYWTFSDVFEEQGVVKTPFYGGFGLIAEGNIPKASFNAFRLLHMLGNERIPLDSDSTLVTRRADGSTAIAVWNYAEPEEAGQPRDFAITLTGFTGVSGLRITTIDASHGSALSLWESMGRPAFPSREEQQKLRQAAELPSATERTVSPGGQVNLRLQPKSLALIELTPR